MRRPIALTALVASAALLLTGAAGRGQPPSGISRPDFEGGKSRIELGKELFAANCASCHGIAGRGPDLTDAGALAADFYLRTGYMPLGDPDEQPMREHVLFSETEIRALVSYVASLGNGPPIPDPHPEQGDIAAGQHMFAEHCAGCHQIAARGGVATGARVPPLQDATATQIAEAVRIGPYLMPHFSRRAISDAELDSIVKYVLSTRHPPDRGGWGIGNVGPIPEGMVTWLLAMVALVSVCVLIGKRVSS